MQFKVLSDIVSSIISTIQNTAIASVKSLRSNTYNTKITNLPKIQNISGEVKVDQSEVSKEVKRVNLTTTNLLNYIKKVRFPREIKVTNFPKPQKAPSFPKSFSVSNFPKFPKFPKTIEVSNQPISEFEDISDKLSQVKLAINAIKLDPKINVQTPKQEKVIVPPANVSVTQQEIDYEKLSTLLAEQIPQIEYNKLAETLGKELADMVVSIGGSSSGGKGAYKNSNGRSVLAQLDDLDRVIVSVDKIKDYAVKITESGDYTYIATADPGTEESEAKWQVIRLDASSGLRGLYADRDSNFDNIATDLTALSYS